MEKTITIKSSDESFDGMYYVGEGNLYIEIPIAAIMQNAINYGEGLVVGVKDPEQLAFALGRELCDCCAVDENFYINPVLDAALGRVIEQDHPSLKYNYDEETDQ